MQFRTFNIGSWNVRGSDNPGKKAAVLSTLETHGVHLACLQETHLAHDTITQFRSRKFQRQYHSIYSSYSRGASIIFRNGISFSCREVSIDKQGCYVFLHCSVEEKVYVVANLYIRPPFKLEILYKLMEFLADKEGIPVIVVGDFNKVLDKTLDRFPPASQSDSVAEGGYHNFWWDIWRTRNPKVQQYSCFSSSYTTLSRLDMAPGNEANVDDVHWRPMPLKGL